MTATLRVMGLGLGFALIQGTCTLCFPTFLYPGA